MFSDGRSEHTFVFFLVYLRFERKEASLFPSLSLLARSTSLSLSLFPRASQESIPSTALQQNGVSTTADEIKERERDNVFFLSFPDDASSSLPLSPLSTASPGPALGVLDARLVADAAG